MKLLKSDNLSQYQHRAIIGSKENIPRELSESDTELFKTFLNGEDSFKSVVGLEESICLVKENSEAEEMRLAGAKWRDSLEGKVSQIAILGTEEKLFPFIEGFLLSNYQFNKYFSDKEEKEFKLETIYVPNDFTDSSISELLNISSAIYWARDMVNEPVSFLNAEQLSEEIKVLAKNAPLEVNVLEKAQIEALKMGGLLAVNQGSIDPPTFTIVEYRPENPANKKPIVLVGKGVVYDTGGLSLKPTPNSMDIMKSDMGGAACMAGAIYLAALQKLPLHLIALIPATDNRPGLNAYAPGDVVTMYNGKTVEVLNTDAEGRMILADALSYSKKYDPELVIDAATLTGAAHRAIGDQGSIIMGNADDALFDKMETAGQSCYERVVRFPFWKEYDEQLKSPIADLKNLGGPTAGMITAGKFLANFVESPYIHMDIAGPAWMDSKKGYRTKGGSGTGVRLLYQFLKKLC